MAYSLKKNNKMKEFYNSRVGQYVIYGLTYLVFWKLAGFEFTVIIVLTTILGEIHYQYMNPKK